MLNSLHKELRMWYNYLFKALSLNMGVIERMFVRMWIYVIIKPLMGDCVMSF